MYFKQSDDLLRRLITTRARIADTEAAIEVLLDQRRNGLVACVSCFQPPVLRLLLCRSGNIPVQIDAAMRCVCALPEP